MTHAGKLQTILDPYPIIMIKDEKTTATSGPYPKLPKTAISAKSLTPIPPIDIGNNEIRLANESPII